MNGYELAGKLLDKNSGKALYITGYAEPPLPEGTHAPLDSSVIRKPFENDVLLRAVARALGNSDSSLTR